MIVRQAGVSEKGHLRTGSGCDFPYGSAVGADNDPNEEPTLHGSFNGIVNQGFAEHGSDVFSRDSLGPTPGRKNRDAPGVQFLTYLILLAGLPT